MSNRWEARESDPIDGLRSSDTEVLSLSEERALLSELDRCKSKLADALGSVPEEPFHEETAADAESSVRPLSREAALGVAYRGLLEIRTKLALSNMKLVAHVAKRFRGRGISYSDLIQDGFQGLLEAIDRFDLSHGTKLATYATWWIRQAMQQAVATGAYPVRLTPRHLRRLAQDQEGTGAMTIDRGGLPDRDSSLEMIRRIQAATRPAVSLDSWSIAESGFNWHQGTEDSASSRIDELDAGETIGRLMDSLGFREQEVLALRFGLGGSERLSLSQTGVRMGVSKERIRQIQDRAIEKLRVAAGERIGNRP